MPFSFRSFRIRSFTICSAHQLLHVFISCWSGLWMPGMQQTEILDVHILSCASVVPKPLHKQLRSQL